jgi:hypothetical protein
MRIGPENGRIRDGSPWSSETGDVFGAFDIVGPCGQQLHIIASPGDAHEGIPGEHVSVSARNRCPNWMEMCFVKDLFWNEEEAVMQLHPPRSQYVNQHAFCLHLWRPINTDIPMPPMIAVGVKLWVGHSDLQYENRSGC